MSYVRRGTPYFRGPSAPLLPNWANTIEGCRKLGGASGLAGLPVIGTRPVMRRGMRGMGGMRGLAGAIGMQSSGQMISSTGWQSPSARGLFRVGQPWTISITGAMPNAPVWANLQLGNYVMPMSGQQDMALSIWTGTYQKGDKPVGVTDAGGNWSASGVFSAAQVGSWHQMWGVGADSYVLDFDVADSSGSVPVVGTGVVPGGSPYYLQAQNNAPGQTYTQAQLTQMAQVPAGGIPDWARAFMAAITPAMGGGPRVTLRNTTSGNNSRFSVGDQFQISISGGPPNSPVVVVGGANGRQDRTQMGTSDGSGNWVSSGSMSAAEIGSWQEAWSVGGVPAGSLSFTVSAVPVGGGGGGGPQNTGGGGGGGGTGPSFDIGAFLTGSAFMGIPNWTWLAGLAALFALGGRK